MINSSYSNFKIFLLRKTWRSSLLRFSFAINNNSNIDRFGLGFSCVD